MYSSIKITPSLQIKLYMLKKYKAGIFSSERDLEENFTCTLFVTFTVNISYTREIVSNDSLQQM